MTLPMKHFVFKIGALLLYFLILQEGKAFSLEYQFGAQLDERFYIENNYFDSFTGEFDRNDTYNIVTVSPDFYLSSGKKAGLYLLADFSWIHSWDADEPDEINVELANAYVGAVRNKTSVYLGLQTFQVGKGFIMESAEPGITLNTSGPGRFYASFQAARVIDTSPLVSIIIGYKIDFLENLEIFGTWFNDSDNRFADMLNNQGQALTDRWLYQRNQALWVLNQAGLFNFVESEGDFFWMGTSSDFFIKDIYVSGIFIIERGNESVTLEYPSRVLDFHLSSYLLNIDFGYNVTDRFSAGAFVFVSGGDLHPEKRELNVFISPMPYNPRTAIFFNGNFNDQKSSNSLSKEGLRWAGVIAPGVTFDMQPAENFNSELTFAAFFPEKKPYGGQKWYGWEVDILLTYMIQNRHKLFFETAFFQHGDFYTADGQKPDSATQFIMGIHTFF